jgi:hypothetical protein
MVRRLEKIPGEHARLACGGRRPRRPLLCIVKNKTMSERWGHKNDIRPASLRRGGGVYYVSDRIFLTSSSRKIAVIRGVIRFCASDAESVGRRCCAALIRAKQQLRPTRLGWVAQATRRPEPRATDRSPTFATGGGECSQVVTNQGNGPKSLRQRPIS